MSKPDLQGTRNAAQEGVQALKEKQYKAAILHFEVALEANPNSTDNRFRLASALLHDGQLARARDELHTLLTTNPPQGKWHAALAMVLKRQGDREGAIETMRRAIALDGDVGKWGTMLSAWEAERDRPERAGHTLFARARVHAKRADWGEALKLVDEAIATTKSPAKMWFAFKVECESRLLAEDEFITDAPGELSPAFYDFGYSHSLEYALPPEETSYLPVWEWIIARLPRVQRLRILDVGCGPGQFASLLLARRPDISYTGLDFSPTAIQQARQRCVGAHFVCADVVRTTAIEDASYDAVISTEFLEHVGQDTAVLARLRPGALFLGSVPDFDAVAHVRHFQTREAVLDRYGPFLREFEIASIGTGKGRTLYAFTGRVAGKAGAMARSPGQPLKQRTAGNSAPFQRGDAPVAEEELDLADEMLRQGKPELAESVLARFAICGDASSRVFILHARALIDLERWSEALSQAVRAEQLAPGSTDAIITSANALMKLGRFDQAVEKLSSAARNTRSAEILELLALAQSETGDYSAARSSIADAVALEPRRLRYRTAMADVVIRSGDLDGAEALLRDTITDFPEYAGPRHQLARLLRKQMRWDDAIALWADFAEPAGQSAGPIKAIVEDLLRAGRSLEALGLIESLPKGFEDGTEFDREVLGARALDALGREEDAIARYHRALMINPQSEQVLQRITIYDQENGLWPQNRPLLRQLEEVVRKRLPRTLKDGLEDLWPQARRDQAEFQRAAWARDCSARPGVSHEAWCAEGVWGARAHRLIQDWWRFAPERSGEITDLVDPPDFTAVWKAVASGRGCVLAGSHFGPIFAGVQSLQESGVPLTRLQLAGAERAAEEPDVKVLTAKKGIISATAMIRLLEAGESIATAVDTQVGATVTLPLLDRTIRLAAGMPRMIAQHASASFWCQPLWRGARITLELERLPDRLDGEPFEDWDHRWYGALLRKIEMVVRGDPRNLLLLSNLWGSGGPGQYGARLRLREEADLAFRSRLGR